MNHFRINTLKAFSILFLAILASFQAFASEIKLPESVTGAVCIIRSGDKIVVTDELITGKFSLPGGGFKTGESPRAAVERETWEEAGLVVTAGDLLKVDKYSAYFDCKSDDKIIIFEGVNEVGGSEMPIWFAPHYGVEVKRAMLVAPQNLDQSQYRYENQYQDLKSIIPAATNQQVQEVSDLVSAAPKIHQSELKLIIGIQQAIESLPSFFSNVVFSFLALGNLLLSPVLVVAVIPFILWRFGRVFTIEVIFVISVTTMLSLIAQIGLALPRPFVYMPQLELASSFGFGLPSVQSAVSTALIVLCLHRAKRLYWDRLTVIICGVIAWQSLAMIVLGVHYFTDVLAGLLFGYLVSRHLIKLETKPDVNLREILLSKGTWWAMSLLCMITLAIWPQPVFAQWLALVIAMSAMISVQIVSDDLSKMKVQQVLKIVVVLCAVSIGLLFLKELASSRSLYSMIVDAIHYPILALILAGMFPRHKRVKK